jgi:hypothetical protein
VLDPDRLARLMRMDFGEICHRGGQGLARFVDRLRPVHGAVRRRSRASARAKGSFGDPARFFAGASANDVRRVFESRFPEERALLLRSAEAALRGRLDLLGFEGLQFGDPVDWLRDPLSGRRAPLLHWTRLDPLDVASVGDIKVVWELNRHQWIVRLAAAYRLTRDERFARAALSYIDSWIAANPAGRGINWASSLEVAFRAISWCWVAMLLAPSAALDREHRARWLDSLAAHGRHIARYLSRYSSPNTHLTGEALALVYLGTTFPELRRARALADKGVAILNHECRRQIREDGTHFEQSTCYHRYTTEFYLHYLILAARASRPAPDPVGERVMRSIDALLALRRPDGRLPRIGDADGGSLMPFQRREPDDGSVVFALGGVHFGRADFVWAAGAAPCELLWLLGPDGVAAFDRIGPLEPPGPPSRKLRQGGWAVLRSAWGAEAHQLTLDAGPLGCPITGAHGHADLLAIECSVFGQPMIVDPGMSHYAVEPAWRDSFRGTAAHATIRIDGRDQARPHGPFGWESRPSARLRRFDTAGEHEQVDADHEAYAAPGAPLTHRRRIVFVRRRYWVMLDEIEGRGRHHVELRLPCAPRRVAEQDGWLVIEGASGVRLLVRLLAGSPLALHVRCGERGTHEGWFAPDYGRRVPAPVIVHEATLRAPLRVVTVLLPWLASAGAPPEIHPLAVDAAGPRGVALPHLGDRVRFSADGIEVEEAA